MVIFMLAAAFDLAYMIEDPTYSELLFELFWILTVYVMIPLAAGCFILIYGIAFMYYFIMTVKERIKG